MILGFAVSAVLLPMAPLHAITLTEATAKRFKYRILSGDAEIGHHTVAVSRDVSGLTRVDHHRELKMEFLVIPLYAFEMKSKELWDGQTLKALQADTVENGKNFVVQGSAVEDGFAVSGSRGEFVAPANVATTESFWSTWALKKSHLLDTVKGKVVQPLVHPLDDGRWHLEHDKVKADIRFDGDFMSDAYVDRNGHLVRFVRTAS